jgi:hypothetical protein
MTRNRAAYIVGKAELVLIRQANIVPAGLLATESIIAVVTQLDGEVPVHVFVGVPLDPKPTHGVARNWCNASSLRAT